MCQHSTYKAGHRTFSVYVPGYAQGAYFPGDEPGEYCRETGSLCNVHNEPSECPYIEKAGFCEDCLYDEGIALPLYRNAAGIKFCKRGHHTEG